LIFSSIFNVFGAKKQARCPYLVKLGFRAATKATLVPPELLLTRRPELLLTRRPGLLGSPWIGPKLKIATEAGLKAQVACLKIKVLAQDQEAAQQRQPSCLGWWSSH
jgi:hypothetical protein